MIDPNAALGLAAQRIQTIDPKLGKGITRWFEANRSILVPLTYALIRQSDRSGSGRKIQPMVVVERLLGGIQGDRELHAWASSFRSLLRIVVESVLEILAIQQPGTEAGGQIPSLLPAVMPRTAGERLRANAAAINLAASYSDAAATSGATNFPTRAVTVEQREILLSYTGNGGVSLDALSELVPAGWLPTSKANLDEYYTPVDVCTEVARVTALLAGPEGLVGPALEPACGVGRFIGAFYPHSRLRWTGVEYSRIGAAIAAMLYPGARVEHQAFEQFVANNFEEYAGKLALVVTNPPYGKRGGNRTQDPDRSYDRDVAYQYMVERSFDLLRPGGIGVAIVPSGFLSASTADAARARERVLKRHHLLCAYRLPSDIYPGAAIVTDVSFWRARGGELAALDEADQDVVAGKYFGLHPQAILGQEATSGRGRYAVLGSFSRLPNPTVRTFCEPCAVTPFLRPVARKATPEEELPEDIYRVHQLGKQLLTYLTLVGSDAEQDVARAAAMHNELVDSLTGWVAARRAVLGSYIPGSDSGLLAAGKRFTTIAAVVSAFDRNGGLQDRLRQPPNYTPSYVGPATVSGHAEWLYEKQRQLTLPQLAAFRAGLGLEDSEATLAVALVAQGWCEDWLADSVPLWMPERDYYTGNLWPRVDRAKRSDSPRARAQLQKLLNTIGTSTLEDAAPAIREAWVPVEITRQFLAEYLKLEVPTLHWSGGLFKPVGLPYSRLEDLNPALQIALGYCNHDLGFFSPPYQKTSDPTTGEDETAEAALDRERLAYAESISRAFQSWVSNHSEFHAEIVEAFQRSFRGHIVAGYPPDPLPIARWGTRIVPKPHQRSGAWRLIRNSGGLLAYDVGVGKTLTGIAAVAYLRQIGRARRPLIVVPNSIIWKWHREIMRALPDYRVAVIGSVRYLGRDGIYRSRLDDPVERQRKWTGLQLGEFDVALCTYSVFGTTRISEADIREYVQQTPALLRTLGLRAAKVEQEVNRLEVIEEKRADLLKKVNALRAELAGEETEGVGPSRDDDDEGDVDEEV